MAAAIGENLVMDILATSLLLAASLTMIALVLWRMRRPARVHRIPLVPREMWLFLLVLVALLTVAHLLHLLGLRGPQARWLR